MKTIGILLASGLVLAGCEKCEPRFKDGQIVRHKIISSVGRGVVIETANTKNLERLCLAQVRWQGGALQSISVEELEIAK